MAQNLKLHNHSCLIESDSLSKICKKSVLLKLENTQPSGSFKIRGIGNLVQTYVHEQGIKRLVSASGGNAGMATAYAGKNLGIPVTVVIPRSTPKMFISALIDLGATVEIHGRIWNEAHEKALEMSQEEHTLYVHPYEHPLIWAGYETLVDEIFLDCRELPAAIVLSVGGGGMLCGVLQGLQKKGVKIPVIAMETNGAHCFNAALAAGKSVSIGNITSMAKTLGALSVTPHVFDLLPNSNVLSRVVSDKEAVDACERFANDHRMLVELSCSAALSAAYSGIIESLVASGEISGDGPVVFVVCGGNGVTIPLIEEWKRLVSK